MARPASRSATASPQAPGDSPLADLVLGRLVDRRVAARPATPAWRFGPVVLVSHAPDAATQAVRGAAVARGVDPATLGTAWNGRTLDAEIASALAGDRLDRLATTLAGSGLVVVDAIDRGLAAERQYALVHLLDSSAAAGTAWCVSVAVHPADGLVPQCLSRLAGGLVVPLSAAAGQVPAPAVSLTRIFRASARLHDVPLQAVVGPARSRTIASARSLAMYLARTITGRSFQAIGVACGGRDHTTVLHGVRVCAARIARDPVFAAEVRRLTTQLTGPTADSTPVSRRSGVGSKALARSLGSRRRGRRRMA